MSVPGPCRYCARTGASCRIATPRRKRPYYHVTEEEYQCSIRILEHFFPDRDLNLQTLRSIANDVTNGKLDSPTTQGARTPVEDQASTADEGCPQDVETVVESVNDLHEPLGCLMKDSQGRFRKLRYTAVLNHTDEAGYIGAHSEIPFNDAVCSIGTDKSKPPNIIGPPKIGAYPPALPTPSPSADGLPSHEQFYLPPRAMCDHYIALFLEDVHSTHWFYSIETFLSRVDSTYAALPSSLSNSWLCSLYAIFAIAAANSENGTSIRSDSGSSSPLDQKTSTDYISLAKQLVPGKR